MAEIIAGVAGFVAITQLGGQFYTLSNRLNRYARHITHAQAEIKDVDLQVSAFTLILRMFGKHIDDALAKNLPFFQAAVNTQLPSILSQQSKTVLRGFNRVLKTMRPLRDDITASRLTKLRARVRWALRNDELEPLKTSLVSIQVSMAFFCCMLNLRLIEHEIQVQKQEGFEDLKLQERL